jgi:hypothetical protein
MFPGPVQETVREAGFELGTGAKFALQARDAGIWWGTLGKLQLLLRKGANVSLCFDIYSLFK